jgi:hypothetical protein
MHRLNETAEGSDELPAMFRDLSVAVMQIESVKARKYLTKPGGHSKVAMAMTPDCYQRR